MLLPQRPQNTQRNFSVASVLSVVILLLGKTQPQSSDTMRGKEWDGGELF